MNTAILAILALMALCQGISAISSHLEGQKWDDPSCKVNCPLVKGAKCSINTYAFYMSSGTAYRFTVNVLYKDGEEVPERDCFPAKVETKKEVKDDDESDESDESDEKDD